MHATEIFMRFNVWAWCELAILFIYVLYNTIAIVHIVHICVTQ
jgi:hypothetical protein